MNIRISHQTTVKIERKTKLAWLVAHENDLVFRNGALQRHKQDYFLTNKLIHFVKILAKDDIIVVDCLCGGLNIAPCE